MDINSLTKNQLVLDSENLLRKMPGCLLNLHKRPVVINCLKLLLRRSKFCFIFRLYALALSVIATATWLGGWVAGWLGGCHTPVLYQNG